MAAFVQEPRYYPPPWDPPEPSSLPYILARNDSLAIPRLEHIRGSLPEAREASEMTGHPGDTICKRPCCGPYNTVGRRTSPVDWTGPPSSRDSKRAASAQG